MTADRVFPCFVMLVSGCFCIWGGKLQQKLRPQPNLAVVTIVRFLAVFVFISTAIELAKTFQHS